MTESTIPDTPVRKAFHAFTQFRPTIAHIILDTPELARAYMALIFLIRLTTATCVLVSAYAFLTTDSLIIPGIALGIFLVLTTISPFKSILIGGVIGTFLLGVQLYPEFLTFELSTFITLLAIASIGTTLVAAYLTKHAVNIASQLWEYEMNPDGPAETNSSNSET